MAKGKLHRIRQKINRKIIESLGGKDTYLNEISYQRHHRDVLNKAEERRKDSRSKDAQKKNQRPGGRLKRSSIKK